MAWTQDDLDRLDIAIASGALSTKLADGREVTYHRMSDLIRARNLVRAAIIPPAPGVARRTSLASF